MILCSNVLSDILHYNLLNSVAVEVGSNFIQHQQPSVLWNVLASGLVRR